MFNDAQDKCSAALLGILALDPVFRSRKCIFPMSAHKVWNSAMRRSVWCASITSKSHPSNAKPPRISAREKPWTSQRRPWILVDELNQMDCFHSLVYLNWRLVPDKAVWKVCRLSHNADSLTRTEMHFTAALCMGEKRHLRFARKFCKSWLGCQCVSISGNGVLLQKNKSKFSQCSTNERNPPLLSKTQNTSNSHGWAARLHGGFLKTRQNRWQNRVWISEMASCNTSRCWLCFWIVCWHVHSATNSTSKEPLSIKIWFQTQRFQRSRSDLVRTDCPCD